MFPASELFMQAELDFRRDRIMKSYPRYRVHPTLTERLRSRLQRSTRAAHARHTEPTSVPAAR